MITRKNFQETKAEMTRFLIAEIHNAADEAGSYAELARRIKKSPATITAVLTRKSFSNLEKIWSIVVKTEKPETKKKTGKK